MSEGINESDRSTSISARIAFAPLYMEETVEQLLEPIELDDADLEIVAGGLQNLSVNFNNFRQSKPYHRITPK